jgi:hypothetical protein
MKTETSFRAHDLVTRGVPSQLMQTKRITDPEEALRLAGLDYTIESVPLNALSSQNHKYGNAFHAAVRSTDGAILGVNSSRFLHFQPKMLGAFAEAILKIRPDAYIELGGQSSDSRTQFLGIALDGEPVDSPGGDKRYRHILLYNGTNGNRKFGGHAVVFELRCMNMFRALMKSGSRLFSLSHNPNSQRLLSSAITAVQNAVRVYDEMDLEIEKLLNTKVTNNMTMSLMQKIAGKQPSQQGRAYTEWERRYDLLLKECWADHNQNINGTAWGIVMAAEAVDEHYSKCRRGQRDFQRINRVLTNNYPLTERALALI